MPRVYRAAYLLTNAIYDAQRMIREGRTKEAHIYLKKKLGEIEKYDKCEYARVEW